MDDRIDELVVELHHVLIRRFRAQKNYFWFKDVEPATAIDYLNAWKEAQQEIEERWRVLEPMLRQQLERLRTKRG